MNKTIAIAICVLWVLWTALLLFIDVIVPEKIKVKKVTERDWLDATELCRAHDGIEYLEVKEDKRFHWVLPRCKNKMVVLYNLPLNLENELFMRDVFLQRYLKL